MGIRHIKIDSVGLIGIINIIEWFKTAFGFEPTVTQIIGYILHTTPIYTMPRKRIARIYKIQERLHPVEVTQEQYDKIVEIMQSSDIYENNISNALHLLIAIQNYKLPTLISSKNIALLKDIFQPPLQRRSRPKQEK
jgi:hypothetical protein